MQVVIKVLESIDCDEEESPLNDNGEEDDDEDDDEESPLNDDGEEDDEEGEENEESVVMQVVVEEYEESLVEWDGPALRGSRNWTSEEIKILLKYIFKRRLNCVELQELGLLRKNQAISKKWSSMKHKIKKLFAVDF